VPGCFAFIGNGLDAPSLHNPSYDFDDANLIAGARFHAAIARRRLARLARARPRWSRPIDGGPTLSQEC
jgi:hypothetical protein